LCLPAGYILYKSGAPAYTILICFIVADLLNRIIQFILMRIQFHFEVFSFLRHAYLRPAVVSVLMTGYLMLYKTVSLTGFWQHVAGFGVTLLVTGTLIGLVGFRREERRKALSFLRRKLREKGFAIK